MENYSCKSEFVLGAMVMNNEISQKVSILQFGDISTIVLLLFVSWILPALSFAASPEQWIKLAEDACISEKDYKVSRKTEVFHESVDKNIYFIREIIGNETENTLE